MNKISFLIIDDNKTDRYLLRRHLQKSPWEIHVFEKSNGKEALDFLGDYEDKAIENPDLFPPTVIFLDVNMPLVNGLEFLKAYNDLRSEQALKSSIIMMFTSSERGEDKEIATSYEFVKDYLVKGEFSSSELVEKIEKYLSEDKS